MSDVGLAQANPSTRTRIAEFLSTQDPGLVFTKAWLRDSIGGSNDEQFGRRMRDLRDYGWVIHTYREDPDLSPSEHRLVTKGVLL